MLMFIMHSVSMIIEYISELNKYVSCGSQSHPRQIASVTFISDSWSEDQLCITPDQAYVSYHLFYKFY